MDIPDGRQVDEEFDEEFDAVQRLRLGLNPILKRELILDVLLQNIAIVYYSLFVLVKKPVIHIKDSFSYHKTSKSKPFVIALIVLTLVDTVVFHVLIGLWSVTVAWIFTLLNLYVILLIIAFYNSMYFLPHVLNDEYLIIQNGIQARVQIQLDNIDSVTKAKEKEIFEKIPKDVHCFVMMFDSPQYEIALRNPVEMKGLYGARKTISKVIFRLDEPNEFMDRLAASMGRKNRSD